MRPSRLSGWTLNPMAGVLIKRDTHTKGRSLVRTRLRLEGRSQKPRMLEPPEVGQGRKDGPPNLQRSTACPHLHFGPLASRTGRGRTSLCFCPQFGLTQCSGPRTLKLRRKLAHLSAARGLGRGLGLMRCKATSGVSGTLRGLGHLGM